MDLITELTIFVLAAFVGFEVIAKVPNTLHTPLMSGTNAIHGIVLIGAILAISSAAGDTLGKALALVAVAFGTINIVGGFLVTDRMLHMFRRRPDPKEDPQEEDQGAPKEERQEEPKEEGQEEPKEEGQEERPRAAEEAERA